MSSNDSPAEGAVVLSIDAQGGDHGPSVMVDAALEALQHDPQLSVLLAGEADAIEARLGTTPSEMRQRIEVLPAEGTLASDASPREILRNGQSSSMGLALSAVAQGRAQACVSAGNTVALMTLGVKLIGRLPLVKRPALMSNIPTSKGVTGMLDLGANLTPDATQLVQFALMGAVVCATDSATSAGPSIGLLNVGHEESKGHSVVREANEQLQNSELNYQGFIEGHDLFAGKVDVAVCDGFAGNLILKSSEGLAAMLFEEIRRTLTSSTRARLGAALARPALREMLARLDPGKHNGAPLLGLSNVVIKSHGRSDKTATLQAIMEARREAKKQVPELIAESIRRHQTEEAQ